MVVYTFIGLSITAEPIVESRAAAEPIAVASETVPIPADAVLPEAGSGRLQPVGSEQSARAKLTYKVLGSAFHDGTKTSGADLLYAYAFAYRWGARGNGEPAHYDPRIDAATLPLRRHLLGVRIAGVDAASKSFRVGDVAFVREVFTVEVYLGIPPEVQWAPSWRRRGARCRGTCWRDGAAVERGWAAFSAEEARRAAPWLDIVRSRSSAAACALVAELERDGYRPQTLHAHVTAEEARKRWAALSAFRTAQGHFLVTNGPYKLKSWSADSVTLEAFRDLSYPLGVGSYDAYAIPRRGFVTGTRWEDDRLVLSGDIEILDKFQRSYRPVRTPLKSVPAEVLRRAAPECRYIVTDENDRIVLSEVAPLGAGRISISTSRGAAASVTPLPPSSPSTAMS
jgi:hypothetical protein